MRLQRILSDEILRIECLGRVPSDHGPLSPHTELTGTRAITVCRVITFPFLGIGSIYTDSSVEFHQQITAFDDGFSCGHRFRGHQTAFRVLSYTQMVRLASPIIFRYFNLKRASRNESSDQFTIKLQGNFDPRLFKLIL